MHFLGIGDACDLSSLYLRLQAEGHDVKVYIDNPPRLVDAYIADDVGRLLTGIAGAPALAGPRGSH